MEREREMRERERRERGKGPASFVVQECHTCSILEHFNGPVVHLSQCLHLQVVAIAMITPLPVDVLLEILCNKLREIVHVLELERERDERKRETRERERERETVID